MQKIVCKYPGKKTEIIFTRNILDSLKKERATQFVIIADKTVSKLYGKNLLKNIKKRNKNSFLFDFPSGEKNKNISTWNRLTHNLYSKNIDRHSCILAIGGGVTGDLAGFVASSYMRGIPYIQIPTTMLSMVDSSIGGKVCINYKDSKNYIGAFYQPEKTLININHLKTLSDKEFKNGLTEIIKSAIIRDKNLFSILEKNKHKIKARNKKLLQKLIARTIKIKKAICEKDEHDKGIRNLLNYGHTIGHAIEEGSSYRKIPHGEAVALGMIVEGAISQKLGYLSKRDLERQNKLIMSLVLSKIPNCHSCGSRNPVNGSLLTQEQCLDSRFRGNDKRSVISLLKRDKKNIGGEIVMSLPTKIGEARVVRNIPLSLIHKTINLKK